MKQEPDESTKQFLDALSPSTKRVYSHGLAAFQEFYMENGTIETFLEELEKDALRPRLEKRRIGIKTLNNFIDWLRKRGFKPKTIRTYVAAVQSLAKFYDISLSLRYVQLPTSQPASRKYPWTIEKVERFVAILDKPIYKSIATSMVQSGLSLSDLLSLTYEDIKYELEADITPICIDLSRKKTDVPFMTFLGEWAVHLLKRYINSKRHKRLRPSDRLYPVTARAIENQFAKAAKQFIGSYRGINPCRPHSLRAAFHTILRDHKVDPLYVEFWMGHKLPEHNAVYISKSKEGWRKTYKEQAEPWLTPPNFRKEV